MRSQRLLPVALLLLFLSPPEARSATLEVRVVAPDGRPAASVAIRARAAADAPVQATAQTGRDGRASLELPPGSWLVEADGEVRVRARVAVPGAPLALLVAPGARGWRGLVTDGAGRPVAGVRVERVDPSGVITLPAPPPLAITDRTGAFRVAVPAGTARLRAILAEGAQGAGGAEAAWTLRIASAPVPAGDEPITLALPPRLPLAGVAVDAGGRPLPGVSIWAFPEGLPWRDAEELASRGPAEGGLPAQDLAAAHAVTGPQGRFRLEVAAGRHALLWHRPGAPWVFGTPVFAEAGAADVRLEIPGWSLARVSVTLADGTRPASLQVEQVEARRAADGRFEVETDPSATVLTLKSGEADGERVRVAPVAPGSGRDLGTVTLRHHPCGWRRHRKVRVRVVDALSGARVDAVEFDDCHDADPDPDAPGTFTVKVDEARSVLSAKAPRRMGSVEVPPGVASVTLRLEEAGCVEGRVLLADGRPARGKIWIRGDEEIARASLDRAGRFVSPGLAPGRYSVAPWVDADRGTEPSFRPIRVEVKAGRTALADFTPPRDGATLAVSGVVAMVLAAGATSWGTCGGPRGPDLVEPGAPIPFDGTWDTEGSRRVYRALPPGRYTFIAWEEYLGGARVIRRRLELAPGQSAAIDADASRGEPLPPCPAAAGGTP